MSGGRKRGPAPDLQAAVITKMLGAEELATDVLLAVDPLYARQRSPSKAIDRAIKALQRARGALEEAYRDENWHEPPRVDPPVLRAPPPEKPSAFVIRLVPPTRRPPPPDDDGGDAA
jgi:hypothetical protein